MQEILSFKAQKQILLINLDNETIDILIWSVQNFTVCKTLFLLFKISVAGGYVSFEEVEIYDEIYRICLACVFFLVILRLLKPLSFNYHVFILQRSLFRAKTDLISYLFLLTLCLVAFASYLYLTIGSTVEDFKSMPTSLRTLLQMLLSMISFRFNVEMSSLQAQVVVSLFAFSVSIIGINVFIGILTWNFYYIKLLQTEENVEPTVTRFNQDLNDHFWWRVDKVIRKLVLPSLRKRNNF